MEGIGESVCPDFIEKRLCHDSEKGSMMKFSGDEAGVLKMAEGLSSLLYHLPEECRDVMSRQFYRAEEEISINKKGKKDAW